ncbi:MAG: SDR family oxidoreductase [Halioglobus sp.]|nr:SDR family oxidoreductase [Halioglobus sp.]
MLPDKKSFSAVLTGVLLTGLTALCSAETVLVTGSNSGIGFAFAEKYASMGWDVIATHRRSETPETLKELAQKYDTVQVERMDVTNNAEIDSLAQKMKDTPIDVLINNAGVMVIGKLGDPEVTAAQEFGTLDYEQFDTFMHTNVMGPIKIAEAFVDNLRASKDGKIVNISSTAGSICPPISPFREGYWYKASKVALNMMMKNLAYDLKKDDIVVIMFHPGGVRSEKLKDIKFPGLMEPSESVGSMVEVIDSLTMIDSGKFIDYTGKPQPF